MALFTHLPLDIHHRILSFLLSNRDVAALSVQCRSLHALCNMSTRKRYRRVRITSTDDSLNHAFAMLMEILKRPRLGRYVRHIEYAKAPPSHTDYTERADHQRELSTEDVQLLRAVVCKAGFENQQTDRVLNMLMQATAGGETGFGNYRHVNVRGTFIAQALAALLISVSPDLESMALTPPFYNYTGFYWTGTGRRGNIDSVDFPLDRLLRQTNASPEDKPFLQNLRNIYLINDRGGVLDDGRFYMEMDFIGSLHLFHHLPSIESVSTDLLQEDENGAPGIEPASSNISRIAIHHSSLDTIYLAKVICSCKVLREFQYSIGGRANADGGQPNFNPKTFIQTILTHKETLEVLDVDTEAHIFHFIDGDGDEEEMEEDFENYGGRRDAEDASRGGPPGSIWEQSGSLRDFSALKRLSLGVNFLMYFARGVNPRKEKNFKLVDCLPVNLEYLMIRGYERGERDDYDAQLDSLLALKDSGSCKLTELKGIKELIPHSDDVEDPDDNQDSLWERPDEWSTGDD